MNKPPGNEPYMWDRETVRLSYRWIEATIEELGTNDPEVLLEHIEWTLDEALTTWLNTDDERAAALADAAVCARGMVRFHLSVCGARWRIEQFAPDFLSILDDYIDELKDIGRESQDWELMANRLAVKVNALCHQSPW